MEKNLKLSIVSIEEERVNYLACAFGVVVSIGACILVEGFLDGGPRDYIVLLLAAVSLLIRFLEKKIERFQKYAKYAYMTFPIWGACVLVISNDGKFAGATQIYFMWVLLAVAYCDERMVLLCSSLTILSTACAIVLFPGAMLQLDNIITWFYIFVAYVMESILAVIIANRMRNILLRTQQLKQYEVEWTYLEQLEKKEEKNREFIHNVSHQFIAIAELARVKNCEQIVHLLEELNVNLAQNDRFIYTSHKVINAVLTAKMSEALEQQCEFDVFVEPGTQFGSVTNSDWVAMLGNMLDNAFEAAKQCKDEKSKIVLRKYMERKGRMCVVKIVNHFARKPFRQKDGFVSTKKVKGVHGIGVKSVENTIGKYGGYLQCMIEEDKFFAILALPIEK